MLRVEGLTKCFGGLTAVRAVDASFEAGRISAIIGPNGAGKTTFFNLIAGTLQPTSGRIRFKDADVTDLRADQVARLGVARTFQTTSLFEQASVFDNLIVGHRQRTRSGLFDALIGSKRLKAEERACRDKAAEVLDFVGLSRIADCPAADASQEQRKRIAFALALATEPAILLADEPAGGVNPEETAGLAELMRKIVRSGLTLCLIEHKMEMVMSLADKIIVLDHGEKIAEGSPSEIRSNPAVIEAYLGPDNAAD